MDTVPDVKVHTDSGMAYLVTLCRSVVRPNAAANFLLLSPDQGRAEPTFC